MIKTTIIMIVLIFAAFSERHGSIKPAPHFQNLKLANSTGASITPPMVSYYIKTINDAYVFYLQDLQKNTAYIQNRLEGTYSGYFDVIILKENITSAFYLYSTGGSSTVGWTFVNTAQPNWTYIINTQQVTNQSNIYINKQSTGPGISADKEKVIINIIRNVESQYSACVCLGLDQISQKLTDFDGSRWSIVCKYGGPGAIISGLIRNLNQQYFEGGGKCNYLIWVL